MSEPSILDRTFHIIMKHMVETGQAPFYTEIAAELGVSVEEGRQVPFGTKPSPNSRILLTLPCWKIF